MGKIKVFISILVSFLACMLILNTLNMDFNKKINTEELKVLNGYKADNILKGLKNPTSICFDSKGNMYIAENKENEGVVSLYTKNGEYKEIVKGLNSPVTYIKIEKNILYISHKGKVSKYNNGKVVDIINNLPSHGDYSNNGISIGYDDMVYIAQGSATNSGIVGIDNYENGWLKNNPFLHDIPSHEMILKGMNFQSVNPFTEDKNDVAYTNGFLPFNISANINDQIKGSTISNASILRVNKDGSYVELFSTGIRNPKNIINLSDGSVYVGVQGMENRGSRPIANGGDYIYKIAKDSYLGWPDFEGGLEVTNLKFKPEGKKQPLPLTYTVKGEVAKPLISFKESGRIGYIDISKDNDFGFKGQLFVPFKKGKNEKAKVLIVNPKDKSVKELISNKKGEKLINPSQCVFSPEGQLYILESEKGQVLKISKDK